MNYLNGFRGAGIITSFILTLILGLGVVQKPYTLTTTTHIVSESINHPYDHHYITSDAWMHPTTRPAKMDVHMPVTNDCRVWLEKDGMEDWVFCGMMPWQDKPCHHSDAADFISDMSSAHYTFPADSDLIANFVKMQRIDDSNLPAIQVKSEDACKYETFDGVKVIRNDPASYSIASTHNAVVLVWGAWLVLFIVYAMESRRHWVNKNVEWFTYGTYNMLVIGTVIFVFFLTRFYAYGNGMSESGSLIMPNGSFVYVFFAVVWTLWSTRNDAADLNAEESFTQPTASSNAMIGFAAPVPEPIDQPKAPMAIDVSNFAGTKIKTRAYVQMGDAGRYDTQNSLTQVDVDLKQALQKDINTDNYNDVKFESGRFYVAQIWVLPFSVLALFLFDTGFAMDMDLTFVFTLLFIFCLVDAFVAKLRNVNTVMNSFAKGDDAKKAIRLTLLLVQTVLFLVELSLIVITYNFMDVRMDVDRRRRIGPVMFFFIVHSVNTTLMLALMLINNDTYKESIEFISRNMQREVTWKQFVHSIRQINLFVFAFWVFYIVLQVNKAEDNLKIADHMNVFDGNCEGGMQTTPVCAMGTLWSNMYDPMSSAAYASS